MSEKINIWHLIGSTRTILIFLFVGYGKLIGAEKQAIENQKDIEELKKEVRNIDKILNILENMQNDLNQVKSTNEKFKNDISKFYQLNPQIINPELRK